MKPILFSLFLAAFASNAAYALPNPNPPKREYELMKCVSVKNGTIWASFGHQRRSDSDLVKYFPTEIVVFGPDYSARLLFPDFREGLKIRVDMRPGGMTMEFTAPKGDTTQLNLLQVTQYDSRDDHGFLGIWTATEAGKRGVSDQVACSLH